MQRTTQVIANTRRENSRRQLWKIGDGVFQQKNFSYISNYVDLRYSLDVVDYPNPVTNNHEVAIYSFHGDDNQMWTFDGQYIRSKWNSERVLTLDVDSLLVDMREEEEVYAPQQLWMFIGFDSDRKSSLPGCVTHRQIARCG